MLRYTLGKVVVALLLASVVSVSCAYADDIDDDHALSLDFQTPHTKWAQPYTLGKVRVLYFSSGIDTDPRHIIELMQRFDVSAQAVYWPHPEVDKDLHGGPRGHLRLRGLLSSAFDVFVFNKIPLTRLTSEEQYKILKAVTEGAGLVLVNCNDDRVFRPKSKLPEIPPFLAQAGIGGAYQIKRGRGVLMNEFPKSPYRFGWETAYDYWQEQFGRAVLWAASKEPKLHISVRVIPESILLDAKQAARLKVEFAPARGVKELHLATTIRREDGTTVPLMSRIVSGNTASLELPVPDLRAGTYYAGVVARSHRGVEGWATQPFTVTTSNSIELILPKNWFEENEVLPGEVNLSTMGIGGNTVLVNLRDRHSRILKQSIIQVQGQSGRFQFPIASWMPMLLQVEAVLAHKGREIIATHQYVRITKRHRNKWNFLIWDYPKGSLSAYGEESMSNLGMTLQLAWGNPPLEVAAYDVGWVPYTTWIGNTRDAKGIMTPMCWNDEPNITKLVNETVQKHHESRQHGVFVYSLGDEIATRGACVHPSCLEAYRKYLRQEYGNISALNDSWGTHYRDFSEVTLSSPTDNDEGEALRDKNYPRWFDRQAFHSYNFVMYAKKYRDGFRQLDPQARTGFEGAGGFGDDIDLIIRTLGFWSPYPGPADEIIRSLAPRDLPRANWMGYSKDATSLLRVFWRMVTRGMDAVWWWRWDGIGPFNGFLAPHLGPWPATKEMMQDTKIVRDGLGTLLLHSEMQHDGIAILYSFPSYYANKVADGPTYGDYTAEHVAWFTAIRELGLQFHYISDRMLRSGQWLSSKYKVLILAQAEAMSQKEASVVKDFVRNGGTVIADLRPAIYDAHCKPQPRGALDDLFGVTRKPSAAAVSNTARIEGLLAGHTIKVNIQRLRVDPTIAVTEGKAFGNVNEVPVFIVNRFGNGQAILLNFSMATYPNIAHTKTPEVAADALKAIFASAGIKPTIQVCDQKGERLRTLETIRWRNGNTELLAVFRETGKGEKARVRLPSTYRVYDLRQRRALGRLNEFTTNILPARATFFALTPELIQRTSIRLSTPRVNRGNVVEIRLAIPKAKALHAVRLKVLTPDGHEGKWFTPVVMVRDKEISTPLAIAYNDPPGKWTVCATELFTDMTTQARLEVK